MILEVKKKISKNVFLTILLFYFFVVVSDIQNAILYVFFKYNLVSKCG